MKQKHERIGLARKFKQSAKQYLNYRNTKKKNYLESQTNKTGDNANTIKNIIGNSDNVLIV